MGAGHGHRLHYHGHSVVHRAPAHLKLVALVGFMLVVVATPREWYAAFAVYVLLLLGVVALSRVPPLYLAKRMLIETPFVLFAVADPVHRRGTAHRGAGPVGLRARPAGPPRRCSSRARSACSLP